MVPAVAIAVVVTVPVVIVFKAAVVAVPIAAVEAATFMARAYPARAGIRRPSPVAPVPNVMAIHGIPITVNPDVIGIDVGVTLLSAENLRSGKVWRWFMRNAEIRRAKDRI